MLRLLSIVVSIILISGTIFSTEITDRSDRSTVQSRINAISYSFDADSTIINLVQWSASEGGNDHWYAIIPQVKPWVDHRDLAQTLKVNGESGYLATVLSEGENQFIIDSLLIGNTNQPSVADEFYLGGFGDPGWHWITNEVMSYTNWSSAEPSGDGIAMAIWGASNSKVGEWNDVPHDTAGVGSIHQLWSLVEFNDCLCDFAGDFDNSGSVDIADLTATVDWMFKNGAPTICPKDADINASCTVDIEDLTYRVNFMFKSGPALICGCIE